MESLGCTIRENSEASKTERQLSSTARDGSAFRVPGFISGFATDYDLEKVSEPHSVPVFPFCRMSNTISQGC